MPEPTNPDAGRRLLDIANDVFERPTFYTPRVRTDQLLEPIDDEAIRSTAVAMAAISETAPGGRGPEARKILELAPHPTLETHVAHFALTHCRGEHFWPQHVRESSDPMEKLLMHMAHANAFANAHRAANSLWEFGTNHYLVGSTESLRKATERPIPTPLAAFAIMLVATIPNTYAEVNNSRTSIRNVLNDRVKK